MKNGVVIGVISVFIAIVVIGSVLVPVIDSSTKTTTVIDNEGAIGLRMDKVTSGDFTLTYGLVGDDFTATNGTDTQIIDDMCIFYADDNVAVWMDDSNVRMLGKDANDQTIDAALSDEATITITKSADGVNITDGTVDQIFPVPTWAYVPKSTGTYGFFLNETEINTGGLDVHYVGSFAGVNCYDSINTYDLPITLDAAITGSTLTGAKWIKAADPETEITPLDPGSLTPLDPGVISLDPEPDASIMSMPENYQYTEGDFGYDVFNAPYPNKAVISAYLGNDSNVIFPSVIGGYDVAQIGQGGFSSNVIPSDRHITVIIPDGILEIAQGSFRNTQVSGFIKIPDTVKKIGSGAFQNASLIEGALVLPNSITNVAVGAFENCTGLTSIVNLMDDSTTIGANTAAFAGTSNIKEILNLGTLELTTTSYGLNADEARADIPALGYLAPAQYETVTEGGPVAALLNAIPMIVIISVVMLAIGLFIVRRTE